MAQPIIYEPLRNANRIEMETSRKIVDYRKLILSLREREKRLVVNRQLTSSRILESKGKIPDDFIVNATINGRKKEVRILLSDIEDRFRKYLKNNGSETYLTLPPKPKKPVKNDLDLLKENIEKAEKALQELKQNLEKCNLT